MYVTLPTDQTDSRSLDCWSLVRPGLKLCAQKEECFRQKPSCRWRWLGGRPSKVISNPPPGLFDSLLLHALTLFLLSAHLSVVSSFPLPHEQKSHPAFATCRDLRRACINLGCLWSISLPVRWSHSIISYITACTAHPQRGRGNTQPLNPTSPNSISRTNSESPPPGLTGVTWPASPHHHFRQTGALLSCLIRKTRSWDLLLLSRRSHALDIHTLRTAKLASLLLFGTSRLPTSSLTESLFRLFSNLSFGSTWS